MRKESIEEAVARLSAWDSKQQGRVSAMNEIWYVNDGNGGFHWVDHVFETKIEAERYARECFPDETEDERYARIHCKPVVSYKEM